LLFGIIIAKNYYEGITVKVVVYKKSRGWIHLRNRPFASYRKFEN